MLSFWMKPTAILGAAANDRLREALLHRILVALLVEGPSDPVYLIALKSRHVVLGLDAQGTDLFDQILMGNPKLFG
jgi:hypothetical protein